MLLAFGVVVIYCAALLFIFIYSLVQLSLVVAYRRSKTINAHINTEWKEEEGLPPVTVQLPVYNELYVAERLLQCVASLDYPSAKLQIQVLDDSTDETTGVIEKTVSKLAQQGFNIRHVRRPDRTGFKAGALSHGLRTATGELIAIFDADFLPGKDFLRNTVQHFRNHRVGMVQTRWGHVNENYSLLTQLQAFGLNAHFSVEQMGRNAAGYFINFNGTAGVWRKQCIEEAGGWSADTLTEDLDLSYRAQLKGWQFIFLEDVSTPAELPVTMSALKNQQYRWNKGAAECAKKNLPKVFSDKKIGLGKRIHAAFHLMNSTVFIAIILTALLSVPLLHIKEAFTAFRGLFWFASFFLFGFAILGYFYFTALAQTEKRFPRNAWVFIKQFPLFLSISMGLALHNAVAVLEGYLGRKTSFVRTPKFNIVTRGDGWKENKYLDHRITWLTLAEGLLALYFFYGMLAGIRLNDFGLLPFHAMLTFGFGAVFVYSIFHSVNRPGLIRSRAGLQKKIAVGA